MIITIDGPVGSGKSSVAIEVAKRLGINYLNTGLLYRAAAYLLTTKLNIKPEYNLVLNEKQLSLLDSIKYKFISGKPKIFYDSIDITDKLFGLEMDRITSIFSANVLIRERLHEIQRKVASSYDIVVDGRDSGSVVFPNADYKFFLTASIDVRAKRVAFDEKRKINDKNLEHIKKEIKSRDDRDKNRAISPLIVPNGSIIIDNSNMDLEGTIQEFLKQINS